MANLPCVECCNLDESCCRNPQILWTIIELDNLISELGEDVLKDKFIVRGEILGTIYILNRSSLDDAELKEDGGSDATIKYCSFYDEDNRRCSIYNNRPAVCSTYGDPKYACCPFNGFKEGELTELIKRSPQEASRLHRVAGTNPMRYWKDITQPFIDGFAKAVEQHPEYKTWWDSLPEPNFIRKEGI